MESFIDLLKEQFENNADGVAIKHREEVYTYSRLESMVEHVGAFLQKKGLKKGDRVILNMSDKFAFLIHHLGVVLSGGVSLPLNFAFTKDEMLYFINDSGATHVIANEKQAELINQINPECPNLSHVISSSEAFLESIGEKFENVPISPKDNCFILYSSGTTGTPKGVVHTHHNLAESLLALKKCWRFTKDDVLLNVLPLFHIHGLSFATHLSLISGSSMLLEDKFHPVKTMDRVGESTVFMAVPTIYYALLRRGEFREKAMSWKKTRLFTCGSAPIRPEVLPELEEILGTNLINRYGMTESHVITSLPLDGPFPQGSVGTPLDGIALKLVTEEGRSIFAENVKKEHVGEVGEVKIKSPNLFDHYWKNPEATASEFDDDGFFSTGDLGRLDENGFLTLVGRKKDLIITGGYNVYPPVVERVINEFEQVKESAVVGLFDEKKGEQVVAFVVPDGELDLRALRQFCRGHLVNYQVPGRFEVVDELPRNTMGKILKRVLKEKS
jgi:malonyl-CoA/methylmalonyl-CoA synthetase